MSFGLTSREPVTRKGEGSMGRSGVQRFRGWVSKAPGMVPRTGVKRRKKTKNKVLRERGLGMCVQSAVGEGGEEARVAKPGDVTSRGEAMVLRQ